MRIGVLGGTFDPPHLGHVALADAAMRHFKFDLLLWVVTNDPWQKATLTPADIRLHMCQLVVASHPNWEVCSVDIDRGGNTYSLDTKADLLRLYPDSDFTWIIGADVVAGLPNWHRADELAAEVKFAAFSRNQKTVQTPTNFQIEWISADLPEVSSSNVRELAANKKYEDLQTLLPAVVLEYIETVGLYSN